MVEGRGSVCQLHCKYTKRSKRWGVFDPSPPFPRHHSISFCLYNCFFLFWSGDTTHCIIETRRQQQQHNSNNNTPTKAARTATGLRLFFIIVFRCFCRSCCCGLQLVCLQNKSNQSYNWTKNSKSANNFNCAADAGAAAASRGRHAR